MQAAQMLGGSSTTTSRTATLVFYADATLSKISVPVTLADSTTVTKYTTITVTIGDYTFTERTDFDAVETGDRTIDFNVGYTIPANTTVTIKMLGANVYVNYGAATLYNLPGQIVVTGGSFAALLYVDTPSIWVVTDDNAGYPHIIGYSPDDSIFEGYQPPKPPNSWKIDSNNAGYPWTWGFTEIIQGESIIYQKTETGCIPIFLYKKTIEGIIPVQLKRKEA